MSPTSNGNGGKLPPSMVIQYGYRDDDDSDDDGRRGRLFGGVRQSSCRSLKKIGSVISETKTLLKGASTTLSNMNHLYGYHDDDDDDDSSSYESESSDSEDASVCSKASVASKASQTLKKLGGKLKLTHLKKAAVGSTSTCSSSHKQTDADHDAGSVSSRKSIASAARRVSCQLGKALKVVTRLSNRHGDDDSSLSDEDEDEEKLLEAPTPRLRRAFTMNGHGPKDVHPTREKPRRHFSDPLGTSIGMIKRQQQANRHKPSNNDDDDDDKSTSSSLSDLSDNEDCHDNDNDNHNHKSVYNNNWSMNVTPEIWEQAMQNGVAAPLAHTKNVPLNTKMVEPTGTTTLRPDKIQSCTRAA